MSRNFVASIDIGTQFIRVGVAESLIEGERPVPKMIGFGLSESRGLRHGCITEKEAVSKCVGKALRAAEKSIGSKIKEVMLSVGSTGLGSVSSSAEVIISRADLEVGEIDLEKLITECQNNIPSSASLNREILHTIPISYKLDGKTVIGSPIGMKGSKLEMKCLFVTVLEKHLNDLMKVLEELGVDVIDAVANPIASSLILLSKQQKRAGCILINIGGETLSTVIYENNIPISVEVFPTGSNNITNDIALGLKISLDEAEHVKLGALTIATYPRKKVEEIIEARLEDIFDTIESHLKKIGRNGILPAGIIFTGGGSGIVDIENFAKTFLKLPAKIGTISNENTKNNVIKDSSWSAVYGLCLLGLGAQDQEPYLKYFVKKTTGKIRIFFKQFWP
ncbi:MAG: cell division protein FtsA [Patescibacteria group bacterium]